MKNSYDALIDELADHGRGAPASRFAKGTRFAKAYAPPAKNSFDQLLDDLERIWRAQKQANELHRMVRGDGKLAKAVRGLGPILKSYYKPVIIAKSALPKKPGAGDLIAKAFNTLRTDITLTPAQRGELALKLSAISDRVFKTQKLEKTSGTK